MLGSEQFGQALEGWSFAEHRAAQRRGVQKVAVVVLLLAAALAVAGLGADPTRDRQTDKRRPRI